MNRATAVSLLAGINVALGIDRIEQSIQRKATERYVRPELLHLAVPGDRGVAGAFFARTGVLVAMKCIIATSVVRPSGCVDPRVIGDLSIFGNEYAFATPKALGHMDDLDLAAQSVSIWDVYNPRFLGYGLARAFRMIEILRGPDPLITRLSERLDLNRSLAD